MARGRKKKVISSGPALSATPPKDLCLTANAKKIYRDLAERLRAVGYARDADISVVGVTAAALDLLHMLQQSLTSLPSLVDSNGEPVKIIREIRQQYILVQSLLGSLMLTPRSRSSARLNKDTLIQPKKNADEDRTDILRIIDGI